MSVSLPIHTITAERPHGVFARLAALFRRPQADHLDHYIVLFAIAAPFTNIPQILKVYLEHDGNLSLLSWSLYALFNIPLITHGVIRKDKVVLFNTTLNMCMQIMVIAGILLYR